MNVVNDFKVANLIKSFKENIKDQENLKKFYIYNKITSLSCKVLSDDGNDFLLTEASHFNSLKELLLVKLNSVVSLLAANQIPYTLLKGLHLIKQFPEYGKFRDIKDLDILINKKDLLKALSILESNGWEVQFPTGVFKKKLELFVNHSVTLLDRASGIELDLHWKLAEAYVCTRKFSEDYWRNSKEQSQQGNYKYPKWEYQILFLAIHSYKNKWQQLQSLIDLYVIISSQKINFVELDQLAKDYRLTLIYQQTLELVDLFFGLKISRKKLNLNFHSGKETILRLTPKFEHEMMVGFVEGIDKFKFIFIRFFLPFGPDLKSSGSLVSVFIIKYFRIIKQVIS